MKLLNLSFLLSYFVSLALAVAILILSAISTRFIYTWHHQFTHHVAASSVYLTLACSIILLILIVLALYLSLWTIWAARSTTKKPKPLYRIAFCVALQISCALGITLAITVYIQHAQSAIRRPGYTYESDGAFDLEMLTCHVWAPDFQHAGSSSFKEDRVGEGGPDEPAVTPAEALSSAQSAAQGFIGAVESRRTFRCECRVEMARRALVIPFAVSAALTMVLGIWTGRMAARRWALHDHEQGEHKGGEERVDSVAEQREKRDDEERVDSAAES
jgi:hypothetical protein